MEKDYNTIERGIIRGAIVARFNKNGETIDTGVIERAIEYVRRNTHSESYLLDGRRIDKPDYPDEVIREAIVNAIAHRDYTIKIYYLLT